MKKINSFIYAIAAGFLLFALAGATAAQETTGGKVKTTTVYLVRHAERGSQPPRDPSLNEAGKQRAERLAQLLEKANIKAIYTSQFRRTIETGEPLAKKLGIEITPQTLTLSPSNPREVSEESIKLITDAIEKHAGESVLVIGHTNTVPQVIKALGGDVVPTMDEQKFDDLFVVTITEKGKAKVVNKTYDAPAGNE